jgi:hypothetical protein
VVIAPPNGKIRQPSRNQFRTTNIGATNADVLTPCVLRSNGEWRKHDCVMAAMRSRRFQIHIGSQEVSA